MMLCIINCHTHKIFIIILNIDFDNGLILFGGHPALFTGTLRQTGDTLSSHHHHHHRQTGGVAYPSLHHHKNASLYSNDSRKKLLFNLNWKPFTVGFLILCFVIIICMTCIMSK